MTTQQAIEIISLDAKIHQLRQYLARGHILSKKQALQELKKLQEAKIQIYNQSIKT